MKVLSEVIPWVRRMFWTIILCWLAGLRFGYGSFWEVPIKFYFIALLVLLLVELIQPTWFLLLGTYSIIPKVVAWTVALWASIMTLIVRPLVNKYESREENYKEVIRTQNKQLDWASKEYGYQTRRIKTLEGMLKRNGIEPPEGEKRPEAPKQKVKIKQTYKREEDGSVSFKEDLIIPETNGLPDAMGTYNTNTTNTATTYEAPNRAFPNMHLWNDADYDNLQRAIELGNPEIARKVQK